MPICSTFFSNFPQFFATLRQAKERPKDFSKNVYLSAFNVILSFSIFSEFRGRIIFMLSAKHMNAP